MQTVTRDGKQRLGGRPPQDQHDGDRNHEETFPNRRGSRRASVRTVSPATAHPCGKSQGVWFAGEAGRQGDRRAENKTTSWRIRRHRPGHPHRSHSQLPRMPGLVQNAVMVEPPEATGRKCLEQMRT